MKSWLSVLFFLCSNLHFSTLVKGDLDVPLNGTNSSWSRSYEVAFTHCGSGSGCGGHQTCSNYELALSDAYLWSALGLSKPQGGVTECPTSYFDSDADCCNYATCPYWLRNECPSCPLDSASATAYPVCVTSKTKGKTLTAYVTGCCPSNHPCNVCKAQYGVDGGCTDTKDQADLCDNLWYALGSPSQSTTLSITIGACAADEDDNFSSDDGSCSDVPPDNDYSCEEQKEWGKCSSSWMTGYCCKTCFDCQGCS